MAEPSTRDSDLFLSVDNQIKYWKERSDIERWPFSFLEFELARTRGRRLNRWGTRLCVPIVVPYFETMRKTFDILWSSVGLGFRERWYHRGMSLDTCLRVGKKSERSGRRLAVELIDFGANQGAMPMGVREKGRSPHAGVLAGAAVGSAWLRSMNGTSVPFVWIPGYEMPLGSSDYWTGVPSLRYWPARDLVELDIGRGTTRNPQWAVPEIREDT